MFIHLSVCIASMILGLGASSPSPFSHVHTYLAHIPTLLEQDTETTALSQEAIQQLKAEATAYAIQNAHIDPWTPKQQAIDALQVYLFAIIDDPAFQQNPTAFVQEWIVQRGNTLEYRILEDTALTFFKEAFFPSVHTNACESWEFGSI